MTTNQVNGISEYEKQLTPKQQKYIATYIQRVYLELEKIKTEKELNEMPSHLSLGWLKNSTPLGLLKHVLHTAMERRNLICDVKDAGLPQNKKGKCQYEYHEDNNEKNPSNQKLNLIPDYDEDSNKFIPNTGIYVCDSCLDDINDHADGYVSCDMDDYEP